MLIEIFSDTHIKLALFKKKILEQNKNKDNWPKFEFHEGIFFQKKENNPGVHLVLQREFAVFQNDTGKLPATINVSDCITLFAFTDEQTGVFHADTAEIKEGMIKFLNQFNDKKITLWIVGGVESNGQISNLSHLLDGILDSVKMTDKTVLIEKLCLGEKRNYSSRRPGLINYFFNRLDSIYHQYFNKNIPEHLLKFPKNKNGKKWDEYNETDTKDDQELAKFSIAFLNGIPEDSLCIPFSEKDCEKYFPQLFSKEFSDIIMMIKQPPLQSFTNMPTDFAFDPITKKLLILSDMASLNICSQPKMIPRQIREFKTLALSEEYQDVNSAEPAFDISKKVECIYEYLDQISQINIYNRITEIKINDFVSQIARLNEYEWEVKPFLHAQIIRAYKQDRKISFNPHLIRGYIYLFVMADINGGKDSLKRTLQSYNYAFKEEINRKITYNFIKNIYAVMIGSEKNFNLECGHRFEIDAIGKIYNCEILMASSDAEKLKVIIKYVKKIVQPEVSQKLSSNIFNVLLNRLLHEEGLLLSLWIDYEPNMSVDNLEKSIKSGQEYKRIFCKGEVPNFPYQLNALNFPFSENIKYEVEEFIQTLEKNISTEIKNDTHSTYLLSSKYQLNFRAHRCNEKVDAVLKLEDIKPENCEQLKKCILNLYKYPKEIKTQVSEIENKATLVILDINQPKTADKLKMLC